MVQSYIFHSLLHRTFLFTDRSETFFSNHNVKLLKYNISCSGCYEPLIQHRLIKVFNPNHSDEGMLQAFTKKKKKKRGQAHK